MKNRINLKKEIASFICFCICLGLFASPLVPANAGEQENNTGIQQSFRNITVDEMVAEMGAGWNLGNTMDGHTGFTPNETLWQSVETSKKLIKSIHDMGFNTVRVPVTWGNMINDEDYSIKESWISRVQDIVDYCISQDMYVIINIHHDGAEQTGWLRIASDEFDLVKEKYQGVWNTIAERFKNYDEHLLFESMNEVTGPYSTEAGILSDTEKIMELNQIFVDTVRATGSNNAQRWLVVCGKYTNIEYTTNEKYGFDLPTDSTENKIFVSVHYYDWTFGMKESLEDTDWSYTDCLNLEKEFKKLSDRFTSKGIPVLLGEYGCINKNNAIDRAYHIECVSELCRENGVVGCYWDQGEYDNSKDYDYCFSLVDRRTGEAIDKTLTDALIRGYFNNYTSEHPVEEIIKDTTVKNITEINLVNSMVMTLGDVVTLEKNKEIQIQPDDNNDILLWSSEDADIASVYNGTIHANCVGTVILHAYSQSGSAEDTVLITILPSSKSVKETYFISNINSIEAEAGEYFYLDMEGRTFEKLVFLSSDETVFTVSAIGKVLALAPGTAYLTIINSNGATANYPVTVYAKPDKTEMLLALNVYYNDNETGYYLNEVSERYITVDGDGTYTLDFDCDTDLSDAARAAGVTGLHNITAIYIKDHDVTLGNSSKSPLASCSIMYNEITVDGTPLTIIQTEPKSAIKSSGIFDTNDPFNSWDGSMVSEVEVVDHVLNITSSFNGELPNKISVTFTLSDMRFASMDSDSSAIKVSAITAADEKEYSIFGVGESVQIGINVGKQKAGAKISFLTSDASIAYVNSDKITADSDGMAYIPVYAVSAGITEITAVSENGKSLVFTVNVKEEQEVPVPTEIQKPEDTVTKEPAVTEIPEPTQEEKVPESMTITPVDTNDKDNSEMQSSNNEGIIIAVVISVALFLIAVIIGVGIWSVKKK